MPERLIVAPAVGVFRPRPVARGARIYEGEVVGHIIGPGTSLPVRSPFGGTLMGMLAQTGERLRKGQPVAWLLSRVPTK
jgi:hypothetical protein